MTYLKQNWLEIFTHAGAVWSYEENGPHAAFEMAPLHTNFYFHTGIVSENSQLVDAISQSLAALCRDRKISPDWVISYKAGIADGSVFSTKLAALLSVRSGSVDLTESRCLFKPEKRDKAILITDDIVSGKSLDKTIALIEIEGTEILSPILTLGNLSGSSSFRGREIVALFNHDVQTWREDDCALCKRGSTALKSRKQWRQLCVKSL